MSEICIDQNGSLPELRHSHRKACGCCRSSLIFAGACDEQDLLAFGGHFIGNAGCEPAQVLRVLRIDIGICDQRPSLYSEKFVLVGDRSQELRVDLPAHFRDAPHSLSQAGTQGQKPAQGQKYKDCKSSHISAVARGVIRAVLRSGFPQHDHLGSAVYRIGQSVQASQNRPGLQVGCARGTRSDCKLHDI